jgi:hypothetical protein
MESVSARFEKFEPVHRVSDKFFFETGLQTGPQPYPHFRHSSMVILAFSPKTNC